MNQSLPAELGVKFTSSSSGFITGIRFYKGVNNTGHARRESLEQHRNTAGERDLHWGERFRLAASEFFVSGGDHSEHRLCCFVL